MKNFIFASAALSLLTTPAWADQCAYVRKAQAESFASQIHVGDVIYHLCEPCNNGSAADGSVEAITVESVGYQAVGYEDFYQVVINGGGIDLAYTYKATAKLENNNRVLVNAALLVACPTTGVTPSFVALAK